MGSGPLSGPLWGGPFMRRRGFPLFPTGGWGGGWGGGYGGYGGFGGFGGGSLLGDLAAGGIGYLMGRRSGQQYQQYQQYQQPQYQQPQYQPPPTPQYQPPANAPYQQAAGGANERLAQLKLLGHLRDQGMLTNDEFEREKQRILQGQ
ncbi:MAG TPA: SHOCT domain-containing protein [Ktedonobacteraceae bacterium]|nr:SHOCT domain-containing protein [Ktedonobacteraceae bacterium]